MDLNEIQNLIKFVAKSGVNEVNLETNEFKITIKSGRKNGLADEFTTIVQAPIPGQQVQAAQVVQAAVPAPAATTPAAPAAASTDGKYVTIKSPMIGTFYRRPSPDKPLFVEVGSEVNKDSVVCIIEAMKLFNEIEAEVSGKIVKILVDDNSPVEYDQPLFLVDPS